MSKYSKSNYEYGRVSAVDSSSPYSFGKNNSNRGGGDSAGLSGEFWDDIQTEDDDNESSSNKKRSCGCLSSISAFYQASQGKSSDDDNLADLDFNMSSSAERQIAAIYYKLRAGSTLVAAVSFIFWCWAIYNTQNMDGQDLGMYSFFTTLMSSHYVLYRTSRGNGAVVATPLVRVLVSASHGLVCGNYALGVLFAYTVGKSVYYIFGGYCLVFTALWGYVTYTGFLLLASLQKYETELHRGMDEEEAEGEEYLF